MKLHHITQGYNIIIIERLSVSFFHCGCLHATFKSWPWKQASTLYMIKNNGVKCCNWGQGTRAIQFIPYKSRPHLSIHPPSCQPTCAIPTNLCCQPTCTTNQPVLPTNLCCLSISFGIPVLPVVNVTRACSTTSTSKGSSSSLALEGRLRSLIST